MEKLELLKLIKKTLLQSEDLVFDFIENFALEKNININNLHKAMVRTLDEIINTISTQREAPEVYFCVSDGRKILYQGFYKYSLNYVEMVKTIHGYEVPMNKSIMFQNIHLTTLDLLRAKIKFEIAINKVAINMASRANAMELKNDPGAEPGTLDISKMDHCRKQHSTPPATGTKPPAKKFTKTLSSNQQDYLYNKLTEKSVFLPIETGRESFNFVFGGSVKPDSFQPLEWQKNVQLLRELLEPLQHPDIPVKEDYVKQVPDYFIKKDGSRLKLAKPKAKYDTLSDKLTEIIENLATL